MRGAEPSIATADRLASRSPFAGGRENSWRLSTSILHPRFCIVEYSGRHVSHRHTAIRAPRGDIITRRSIDILVAAAALIVFSPLLIAVAFAIMMSSAGGPFYRGWRVGFNGKPFRMWKFRTMERDADSYGPITGPNDPRVFPLGRLLRRAKIDEFPQFINLLVGDMTLVGPRPESPGMVEFYKPWHRAVLSVKPGITGPVQIETVEEADIIPVGVDPAVFYVEHLMDYKVQLYLDHMDHRTVWGDTKVVVSTIGLILHAAFGFPWVPKRQALSVFSDGVTSPE